MLDDDEENDENEIRPQDDRQFRGEHGREEYFPFDPSLFDWQASEAVTLHGGLGALL